MTKTIFRRFGMRAATLAFSGAMLFALPVMAQDTTPAQGPPPGGRTRPSPAEMQERQLNMLTQKLSLTPDQVTQVKAIQSDEATQMKALRDDRGRRDPHGYKLQASVEAVADELACAAGLVCGKLNRAPACIVRGFRYEAGAGSAQELLRARANDLFR